MQSPRKNILSQIGSEQPAVERARNIASNDRFQRLSEVFRFSPTHSRELTIPEISFGKSGRSKYSSQANCLEQLNSIFKLRKISDDLPFFEDRTQHIKRAARSKSKINKDIEHSIIYIENLKNQRSSTQGNQEAQSFLQMKQQGSQQTVISAIGLHLPDIRQKKDEDTRFLTEPSITQRKGKQNQRQQIGLYSYLERQFMERKNQELTGSKIIDYAKNPNNRNFHRAMLEKSRKYLKQSIQNNYKEVSNISNVIEEESKKMIQLEIDHKKRKYEKEYFARNNVPYFSFLTLKQKEKQSVLKALRKRSVS